MSDTAVPTAAEIKALQKQLDAAEASRKEARKAIQDAKRAAGADDRAIKTGRKAAVKTAKRELERRERARQREMHARAAASAHVEAQAAGKGIKLSLAARHAVLDTDVEYPVAKVSHDDWVLDDDLLKVIATLQEQIEADTSSDNEGEEDASDS